VFDTIIFIEFYAYAWSLVQHTPVSFTILSIHRRLTSDRVPGTHHHEDRDLQFALMSRSMLDDFDCAAEICSDDTCLVSDFVVNVPDVVVDDYQNMRKDESALVLGLPLSFALPGSIQCQGMSYQDIQ
jgi:hypothetical protein